MDEMEFQKYVDQNLKQKGISLTAEAKAELLLRLGGDTMLLHSAIEKLDLYGEKNLNLNDIKHLVSLNSDVNIFQLTTAFTQGDLKGCMEAVDDMLLANYNYTVMISMLSKRLRTLYNMMLLRESGYSNDEVAARMHVKSGFVYYALKDASHFSSKQILSYLNELADMDQGIKQGTLDPKNSFENFLIRNGKRKHAGYQRTF